MVKLKVLMTTYNLELYIEEALLSVLNQKTDFDYEIVVADDASTDGTINIIRSLQNKFPGKIRLIRSSKNLGSLGNSNRIFDNLECEYFCFIDGDDFLTTRDSLQKRVKFLDGNPEYTMCAGNTVEMKGNEFLQQIVPSKYLNKSFAFKDYLLGKSPFVHTSAIMFRNVVFNKSLPELYGKLLGTYEECAVRGEDFRYLLHLEKGKIYVFDEDIAVYRIHEKGIYQGSSNKKQKIEAAINYNVYRKYFKRYHILFEKKLRYAFAGLEENVFDFYNEKDYLLEKKESFLLINLYKELYHSKIRWNNRYVNKIRYSNLIANLILLLN